MTPTRPATPGPRRARTVAALFLFLSFLATGCGTPQIGTDRAVFREVDALFTAVSMRDNAQLARCETALKALRDAGKLPDDAAEGLAAITAEARDGHWEPAQNHLRTFMEGQRR